jgi:hypothetical protein
MKFACSRSRPQLYEPAEFRFTLFSPRRRQPQEEQPDAPGWSLGLTKHANLEPCSHRAFHLR